VTVPGSHYCLRAKKLSHTWVQALCLNPGLNLNISPTAPAATATTTSRGRRQCSNQKGNGPTATLKQQHQTSSDGSLQCALPHLTAMLEMVRPASKHQLHQGAFLLSAVGHRFDTVGTFADVQPPLPDQGSRMLILSFIPWRKDKLAPSNGIGIWV